MKLKAFVHPERVGGYSVSIPALPGCVSGGSTLDEALRNVHVAAEKWLQSALQELEVEITEDSEDEEFSRKAQAIQLSPEKLRRLTQTHRPPASWYDEEMNSPAS